VKFLHTVNYSIVSVNYFYSLQNFQIQWFDLTLHCAYSKLSINDYEIKILSLINNAMSKTIDQLSVPDVSYKP